MTKEDNITGVTDAIRFALEIDKLKGVLRKVKPISENRYENFAEYRRQIAIFALSLAQTLSLKVDLYRAVAMLFVHDIDEIDAGNKFVFARDGWEERKVDELRAVEQSRLRSPRIVENPVHRSVNDSTTSACVN